MSLEISASEPGQSHDSTLHEVGALLRLLLLKWKDFWNAF